VVCPNVDIQIKIDLSILRYHYFLQQRKLLRIICGKYYVYLEGFYTNLVHENIGPPPPSPFTRNGWVTLFEEINLLSVTQTFSMSSY
jgi:hypothetical protein